MPTFQRRNPGRLAFGRTAALAATLMVLPSMRSIPAAAWRAKVVARLPPGYRMCTVGSEVHSSVTAVVGPRCQAGETLLATLDLDTGETRLGAHVAADASLFSDKAGELFMVTTGKTSTAKEKLWLLAGGRHPKLMSVLPYSERAPRWGVIAVVAPVPGRDEAWIADGRHLVLVNLDTDRLLSRRLVPVTMAGYPEAMCDATAHGPLYMAYSPRGGPTFRLSEIKQSSWRVVATRRTSWVDEMRAGAKGVWVVTGGGNGRRMNFYSPAHLRGGRQTVWSVFNSTRFILFRNVALISNTPGRIQCAWFRPTDHKLEILADAREERLGGGTPLAIAARGRELLVAYDTAVIRQPLPAGCTAALR